MQNNKIVINSRKYDGSIHRSWTADLVSSKDTLRVFVGEFADSFVHPELGHIRKGMISYEYYWMDRWYNIFRFHEPDGVFRNFYCNVNMPPEFNGTEMNYVDLDLDLLVSSDWSVKLLDEDEFRQNALRYSYPDALSIKAHEQITALQDMISKREFPFSTSGLMGAL